LDALLEGRGLGKSPLRASLEDLGVGGPVLVALFQERVVWVDFFGGDGVATKDWDSGLRPSPGDGLEARCRSCMRWSRKYGGLVNSFNNWLIHSGI
jgi:hypothetical protein